MTDVSVPAAALADLVSFLSPCAPRWVMWLAAIGALLITGRVVFARRAGRGRAPVPLAQAHQASSRPRLPRPARARRTPPTGLSVAAKH